MAEQSTGHTTFILNRAREVVKRHYSDSQVPIEYGQEAEAYQKIMEVLVKNQHEAWNAALKNLESQAQEDRIIAVTILGWILNPVEAGKVRQAKAAVRLLSDRAEREEDTHVRTEIAVALGYPYLPEAEPALLKLSRDPELRVRRQATVSLHTGREPVSDAWHDRLIELSADDDANIRDWATLHLAGIEEADREIRDAVARRLNDESEDVRTEAVWGMAYWGDAKGIESLVELLSQDSVANKVFEAAGLYGLPEIQPLVEQWGTDSSLLEWAFLRCSPFPQIRSSVDDEWTGLERYELVRSGRKSPFARRLSRVLRFGGDSSTVE